MSLPADDIAVTHDLPVSVAEMADVLGLPFVVKLVDLLGGTEIKVPKRNGLRESHPLMVLGEEDAAMLCDYCHGDVLFIPISLMTGRRRGMVAKLLKKGFTRIEVARRVGITQRHVRRLANGQDKDSNQGDLF